MIGRDSKAGDVNSTEFARGGGERKQQRKEFQVLTSNAKENAKHEKEPEGM
jgi:hypothetical protein